MSAEQQIIKLNSRSYKESDVRSVLNVGYSTTFRGSRLYNFTPRTEYRGLPLDKKQHNVRRNRYPTLRKGRTPFQYLEDLRRKTKNSTLMGIEPTISAFHKREVTLVGGQRGTFSPQGQIVVRFPNYNVLYPTTPRLSNRKHEIEDL